MEIGARPAEPGDVDVVASLVVQAIEELRARRGGEIWAALDARPAPHEDGLLAEIEAPHHALFVGTIDGVVVGYAAAHPQPLQDDRTLGRISEIFVVPEGRGVGVGESLMGALEAWAIELGLSGLDSIALPGDRQTKNFFETFGMVARAIAVHRPLAP